MIHIHTTVYDSQGYFSMEEDKRNSSFQKASARIQRDKLLDTTTYLKNHGYSEGDRTFTIISKNRLSRSQAALLWYLFKNHATVLLSCSEGFYSGSIASVDTDKGRAEFTFIPGTKYST